MNLPPGASLDPWPWKRVSLGGFLLLFTALVIYSIILLVVVFGHINTGRTPSPIPHRCSPPHSPWIHPVIIQQNQLEAGDMDAFLLIFFFLVENTGLEYTAVVCSKPYLVTFSDTQSASVKFYIGIIISELTFRLFSVISDLEPSDMLSLVPIHGGSRPC